eukprot:TRINITY_DN2102_c0_g2_i4.p1 TRINITY_DN2102_c0_g2~~TRINITY_DN2102_c0_g2_i4.p1  ORF type:complete len:114 (-),score=2.39 TRINITY_DN2102_c0_g2_i4:192-533(-)
MNRKASRIYNLSTKKRLTLDLFSIGRSLWFIFYMLNPFKKDSLRELFISTLSLQQNLQYFPFLNSITFTSLEDIKHIFSSPDFDKPDNKYLSVGLGGLVLGDSLFFASGKDGW